ncbi:hypothetical protein HKD37_10G028639 [Glycine soja]
MKEMEREKYASYSSHDSCKSLSGELSDYYRGHHSSHTKHHSQRREKDRRPQEVNISLPYFHGKDNLEAYLDWEMKVEQLFACHHISEERKVPLATLSFQGYALYWWTSFAREQRIHGDPPVEYWNDFKSVLRKRHIPSYYERELMDKLQRLRQESMSVEEYRQQMELLLLRAGLREEERKSIASTRLVSKLNLTIIPHPKPYKLQWLNEQGEMIVNQQVKVPFSIGTYKDEVNCDIVTIEAGHILLQRPWQFDRKIIYNGLTNEITLTHLGTKFVLHPQTPSQVAKDQLTMKDKRDEEEKLEKQKKKKDSKALSSKAKGKEKEEKDSSKKIVKKENHFATKGDIKRTLLLKQYFYLLLSKETSLSTVIPLELEVIPQVKELLDEGLVFKSLTPCAFLVPKVVVSFFLTHILLEVASPIIFLLHFVAIHLQEAKKSTDKEDPRPTSSTWSYVTEWYTFML